MSEELDIINNSWTGAVGEVGSIVVYAKVVDSTDAIIGNATGFFTASMVGEMIYFEQSLDTDVQPWEVGKTIAVNDIRISDGNTYKAVTAGKTGSTRPIHLEGIRWDGTTSDPSSSTGGIRWEYLHSGWGSAVITRFLSEYAVECTVINRIPALAGAGTKVYGLDEFSANRGYPSHVCFHRERLCLTRKEKVWFSVVGDFLNFAVKEGADITPDMSIGIDITSDELNKTMWLMPMGKLLIGTDGAEVAISELSDSSGFSTGNVKATRQGGIGGKYVTPVLVDNSIVYVQRSGRRIRQMAFSDDLYSYKTTDLSVLNDEILNGEVIQMAYQKEPHSVIWLVLKSGELIGFTMNTEQEVIAWHRHPMGGGALVESVAVIPSSEYAEDEVWLVVKRGSVRTVERMSQDFNSAYISRDEANFLDSAIFYNGKNTVTGFTLSLPQIAYGASGTITANQTFAPAIGTWVVIYLNGEEYRFEVTANPTSSTVTVTALDTIPSAVSNTSTWAIAVDELSGATHLASKTVQAVADGSTHPDVTVSAGGVATMNGNYVVIGLGYGISSYLKTMPIEAGSQQGTAQGKLKRIHRITIRLLESLGGSVGVNGVMESVGFFIETQGWREVIEYRTPEMRMNNAPDLFTGDKIIQLDGGYETFGQVEIVHNEPLPFTLLSIMPQLETQDFT